MDSLILIDRDYIRRFDYSVVSGLRPSSADGRRGSDDERLQPRFRWKYGRVAAQISFSNAKTRHLRRTTRLIGEEVEEEKEKDKRERKEKKKKKEEK